MGPGGCGGLPPVAGLWALARALHWVPARPAAAAPLRAAAACHAAQGHVAQGRTVPSAGGAAKPCSNAGMLV
jgi:hypothetical protein